VGKLNPSRIERKRGREKERGRKKREREREREKGSNEEMSVFVERNDRN
jgi:hypothetical protein